MTLVFLVLLSLAKAKTDSTIFFDEDQETGFIDLFEGNDIFYWIYKARNNHETAPLILWLTGGPGCSSEIALFYENGPYTINEDLSLKKNPHSWNEYANLLYIDQPLGTGFSNVTEDHYVTSEETVATHFFAFFQKFLQKYPEYAKRDFYITGESYAGHYIPAIAEFLLRPENRREEINLKGLAIGNGMTVPVVQYEHYDDFALENQLVTRQEWLEARQIFQQCVALIKTGRLSEAYEFCDKGNEIILGEPKKFNVYDISKPCIGDLCYDFSNMEKFLNREDVRKEMGTEGRNWTECNWKVHEKFKDDWFLNLSPHMKTIVEHEDNLNVLIYYGDLDYICNWRGGEAWVHHFDWAGKEEFNQEEYKKWVANGEESGDIKKTRNLTFLRFWQAGHMVPMDKPAKSLFMLDELLGRKVVKQFAE